MTIKCKSFFRFKICLETINHNQRQTIHNIKKIREENQIQPIKSRHRKSTLQYYKISQIFHMFLVWLSNLYKYFCIDYEINYSYVFAFFSIFFNKF